tara:strand:- start:324 stop:542 length:219 start_codon:yes stop_codon:yes gene_type:complete
MFEQYFKGEMKRLKLKRYEVCGLLNCTMPTLKSRLKNPETFTIGEVLLLQRNRFFILFCYGKNNAIIHLKDH